MSGSGARDRHDQPFHPREGASARETQSERCAHRQQAFLWAMESGDKASPSPRWVPLLPCLARPCPHCLALHGPPRCLRDPLRRLSPIFRFGQRGDLCCLGARIYARPEVRSRTRLLLVPRLSKALSRSWISPRQDLLGKRRRRTPQASSNAASDTYTQRASSHRIG